MPIRSHLRELRTRLLLAVAGIGLGAIGGWFLYDPVMQYIQEPLTEITRQNAQLNFQTIGAGFDLKLRISLWISVFITSPWWIYQIFAFISPGLKKKERRYLLVFGFVGVILFLAGAASGMMMLPRAVQILTSFTPENSATLLQADAYVSFYTRLVLAFGISFLIPEILVVLNFMGLMKARTMLRGWRWAIMIAFIFAAIANPLPSPWPMVVQASVLLLLYLLAILISWLNDRRREKRQAEFGAELTTAAPETDVTLPHDSSSSGKKQ